VLNRFLNIRLNVTPGVSKILGNASWIVVEKLLRMVAGLFVGVWVARYLGPEQFGLLNYAMAFVALFVPLASLGLEEIVIREITQHPGEKHKLLGSAFSLKIAGGFLSLAIATLIIFISRSDSLSWQLVSIFAGIYIFQAFDVIIFWFHAQVQSKYVVLAGSTAFVITTILKIFLIQVKASLVAFAWISLGESIIIATVLILCYQTNDQSILNWKPEFQFAKQLIQKSCPMIFAGLANILYMKIDQVMLGQMLGDTAVGIYSVAVRISEVWYFIPLAIASSVTSNLIATRKESLDQYHRKIQTILNGVVMLAYLISIGMSFLAAPIILHLYGAAYTESIPILIVHIWASIFVFLGLIRGIWLIAEDLAVIYMKTTALGAAINIVLNLILIPRYAGLGAAIATVISYAVASYVSCLFYPRLRIIFRLMNRAITLRWLIDE
jgi:polysaccharide transporter, PST family